METIKEEYSGKIGDCSEKQLKVLQELKDHIKNVMKVNNPIFDDWYLLRFCRARKFKLQECIITVKKILEYRKKTNADEILTSYKRLEPFKKIRHQYSQSVYFCSDKFGRPVKIDKWGAFDSKNTMSKIPAKEMVELVTSEIEGELHCIYPYMSMLEGKRVESSVQIHDMKDFGLSVVWDKDVRDWFSMLTETAQDNYPEQLAVCYIVNAPFLINAAWGMMKSFLKEKTRKKIHILGSNYEKTLFKTIDKDKQPDFLGGTVKDVWPKNTNAPWKQYQEKCEERQSWFNDKKDIISDPLLRAQQIREELDNEKIILPHRPSFNDYPNIVIDRLSETIFSQKEVERESRAFKQQQIEKVALNNMDEGKINKMYSVINSSYSLRNVGSLNSMNNYSRDISSFRHNNKSSSGGTSNNYSMNHITHMKNDFLLTEEIPDEEDLSCRFSSLGLNYKAVSARQISKPK